MGATHQNRFLKWQKTGSPIIGAAYIRIENFNTKTGRTLKLMIMKKTQTTLWHTSLFVGVCVISLGLSLACAAPPEKKAEKKLTGAELYAINCNRCHAERYPMEWNSAQWKTLMTHMRVRANIPAAQAKQILKYLQEDSGN
jgi:mono/diheme cytochrome c family protein